MTSEQAVELIKVAKTPLAKVLIALAYYANGKDASVAEAVWR